MREDGSTVMETIVVRNDCCERKCLYITQQIRERYTGRKFITGYGSIYPVYMYTHASFFRCCVYLCNYS